MTFERTARAAARAALLLATSACAGTDVPAPAQALGARLRMLYPATHFGRVLATPWPGVFEVAMGRQLAYTEASGRYFLFGHLYDMQAQRDLTADRQDSAAQEDPAPRMDTRALPLADAITEVRGRGTPAVYVFSDPDCPYCRRLEAALQGLPDATVHTFLLPLAALHPQARERARGVWCAPSRLEAWHALMRRGQVPPARDCPDPLARNAALAQRLGIRATPTLIAADGRVLQGAADTARIAAWLAAGAAANGAAR